MNARWTGCALLVALFTTVLHADDSVATIKLTVDAKLPSKPVLQHRLLPDLTDMQAGNAIPAFYKCFLEQHHLYKDKKVMEEREKWLNCPLSELPDSAATYGGYSSKQADYAARLDQCDWGLLHQIRKDGIGLLLPDLQELRNLAAVLKVRYRGQIKAGKFDDAIRTHQTMFQMARLLGEHPTLIGQLVGIAISNVAIGPFEELIQQPGAPNFFWSIGQLPSPFMDLRKGMQGERFFFAAEFAAYSEPSRLWTEEDIAAVTKHMKYVWAMAENTPDKDRDVKVESWLKDRMKDEKWLNDVRASLKSKGYPEDKLKKYPPQQLIFHKLMAKLEVARDDSVKWIGFPYWQVEKEMLTPTKSELDDIEMIIAKMFLPHVQKVRRSHVRLDQRLAMLQVIEGLRIHAAENSGKLPAKLDDVKLPLPIDPMSGKPFSYDLKDGTAILRNTPPSGDEKTASYNVRYEVTIRKGK